MYLGKFEIKETKAPHGMALNPEPQTVELVYAGQEVEITSVSSAFYNERQRVQIDLSKVLEQDEKFGIGQNGESSRYSSACMQPRISQRQTAWLSRRTVSLKLLPAMKTEKLFLQQISRWVQSSM